MEKTIEEKESEKIDPRQKRVWYLLHRGKKFAKNEFDDWGSISNNWINVTKWEDITRKSWNAVKNTPYIFLSRAPLTFGHLQLVIPSPSGDYANEEDFLSGLQLLFKEQ